MRDLCPLRRPPLPLAVFFGALAFAAAAEEPAFEGTRLLQNTFVTAVAPAIGDTRDGKILRLARISEKRYLALVEESYFQVDPWADRKQMERERRESGSVSATLKFAKDTLSLAMLDPTGKIVKRSGGGPELSTAVSPYPNSHHLPLVLEASERCPYAILHASSRSLICFDHELGFVEKVEIPLDEIGVPRVTLDGVSSSISFFGRQYSQRPAAATFSEVYDAKPEVPVGFGVRFEVEEGAWRPLPIEPAQLASDLSRLARGTKGEKVQVAPASIQIIPFRDASQAAEFWVLIEAASSERFESAVRFAGTRHFFRSRLGAAGLGAVEALPFWIVQEERADVEIREVGGGTAVHLPAFAKYADLQVFGRGERRFAVAIDLAFKAAQADGTYHPSRWSALQVMALFTGTKVDKVIRVDDDLLGAAAKPLSRGDRWVSLVKLVDSLGKNEYAFWALCGNRQRPKENQRCVAILTLRE
jgi:hypothetical protein